MIVKMTSLMSNLIFLVFFAAQFVNWTLFR
jgi:hypothetical protein